MGGLLQNIPLIGQEIDWFAKTREQGRAAFEKTGVPTAKVEAWKYTKPRELNADDFVLSSAVIARSDNSEAIHLPFSCYQIHFENGIFNPALSEFPQGVEVLPLIEVLMFQPEYRALINRKIELEKYPFAALNSAYLNEGVFVHIDSNVCLKKPIAVINHTNAGAQNLFFNLRNLIVLEKDSSAELVEYYHYSGEQKSRYLANIVNEVYLAQGASLKHYKVQDEAFKANHIALTVVNAVADSAYKSFCLQKGANIARNETRVLLTEKGAFARVDAAYLMNGWATLDTTTDIEHLAPCTNSEQLVKGVVGGDAKGVFQGKIHIARDAVQTQGIQLHRALLLSDTAEVDVKPELEIFADDVKCSHGAASGELDEEALFYMRSRGIGQNEAKQLLIDAYLDDVIGKIEDENIAEWIRQVK